MNTQLDQIKFIKHYFENLPKNDSHSKTKEYGLQLIEVILQLKNENFDLKKRIIKLDKDFEWIEKKADEWMLKAIQNSQIKS